ncbi:MAG TPA: (4Fe-4S)-binding protein, partial [Candidatus Wallbacteria bacterium]|nr:(4Fe-4S)-binding protein [Candidatus Wallbacteria bacterium]
KVSVMMLINKYDINLSMTAEIEKFALDNKIPVIGKVPFNKIFVEALKKCMTVIEYTPNSNLSEVIKQSWANIKKVMNEK